MRENRTRLHFCNLLHRRYLTMKRVYNFSAGPSILPEPVLRRAADEMLDYQGSGQSVMEMSHRSKTYQAMVRQVQQAVALGEG